MSGGLIGWMDIKGLHIIKNGLVEAACALAAAAGT